jgi:uncharacterized protein YabE (DUF348 family)
MFVIIMSMVWRFILSLLLFITISAFGLNSSAWAQDINSHLITVYDRGQTRVFLTKEKILGDALTAQGISFDVHDTVEPSVKEELIASDYQVNIYRSRPVIVVDGATRIKTISPYQTAEQIAKDVGISIYDGDTTKLKPLTNFVSDGAGLQLTITRAKKITIDLYGKRTDVRTQAKTVGDMLKEKNIILGGKGRVSVPESTLITEGLQVRVWREGVQTISLDQEIPVASLITYSADQPIGYRAVQTKGLPGNRSVTYQIEVKDGVEITKSEIANIVTRKPTDQTEVIGLRNDGRGLTQSKGAQFVTDSQGVSHRETYYDLNMSTAMQACGQGGYYTVRPDGAKVDSGGYIIVAANYSIYPKCSIVETSLGAAKVYDTGGFVSRYPTGFDLATDWSYPDGR